MKKMVLIAAMFAAFANVASAENGALATGSGSYTVQGVTIVVSCFRGPWRNVIWDRPNAVFYDSLIAAGYSPATANALGIRVCRDQSLVGNLENNISEVRRIVLTSPRS